MLLPDTGDVAGGVVDGVGLEDGVPAELGQGVVPLGVYEAFRPTCWIVVEPLALGVGVGVGVGVELELELDEVGVVMVNGKEYWKRAALEASTIWKP